ncbi:diacylglycerol kinase family protein [Chitinophaga horti]|uniref:Diacylglycerol kinase family protein n=1 Tax=Chitinophaga horti TaxID=2920382 RepID=A0ABY6J5R6_9BACT|nr:diacylglycerol kinase family protein [Chitinophaga horti]UYQ95029.1 diacylglycerol kinase family protein [Chitinophaga horti]
MESAKKLKLLFVINPKSGRGKDDPQNLIHTFFQDKPYDLHFFNLHTARKKGLSLQQVVRDLQPDGVVAVGGDGTVRSVATVLIGTDIPLGILPAGSANGMARELSLPLTMPEALEVIVKRITQKIDVVRVDKDQYCVHLGDIGLNALMVKYFERSGIRGQIGYARVALKALYHQQLLDISIDNGTEKLERQAFMVVFGNARQYGTGAFINPDGDLSDGIFEVVLIKKISVLELLKMLFRHRPFDPAKTEIISARQVSIHTKKKRTSSWMANTWAKYIPSMPTSFTGSSLSLAARVKPYKCMG